MSDMYQDDTPAEATTGPQPGPQPTALAPQPVPEEWRDVPAPQEQWRDVALTGADIDKKSGTPFALRLEMARAQNPNEAKLVLDKYYGPGNYGQDQGGNWWVMQDGKPTAVFPSGILPSKMPRTGNPLLNLGMTLVNSPAAQNAAAQVGASATPMAGATLGAAAGSPGGPFVSAAGAGLGAAGGYGIDQLVKWYRGLYSQTPTEVTKNATKEATLNAALTGLWPTAQAAGRGVANAFRDWVGVSPGGARMTGQLVDEGARPPIRSTAPEFRSWGDKQALRNVVAGDPWEATNTEYVRRRFEDALRSSGVPDDEIATIISQASHPTIAPTRAPAGEALVGRVQEHAGELMAQSLANRQAAERELRGMERTLRTWSENVPGNLGEDVANRFIHHRQQFGQAASREYKAIDAMNGDEKIFDLMPALQRAKKIVDLADPGSVPPYLRQMVGRYDDIMAARAEIPGVQKAIRETQAAGGDTAQLERNLVELRTRANNNMTTFSEGHEFRNNLREMIGHDFNPTRTPWMGKMSHVEDALDDTFRAMEGAPGLSGDAAKRLRAIDEQYGRGIKVFKDAQVRKLISDIRDGVSVDPEAVAATIVQQGRTESGRRILSMLTPEMRQQVAQAEMRNILSEASSRSATGELQVDGMRLLDALDSRGRASLLGDLYRPDQLNAVRNLARQLAALDGKVSLEGLPPDRVTAAISNAVNRTNQLDQFVRTNPVGAMVSGSPEQIDRAARHLAMPGNEARTLEAANFFGVDSPEWQAVQRHALQGLIRTSLIETASARTSVSGPAIEKVLKRYTDRQQELLFPNGLADDLREVAKQSKFLFPPGIQSADDIGQSLAAKSITLHTGVNILNPRTAYADMRYIYVSMMGWLTDRPAVLRFLADTARSNPSEAKALMGFAAKAAMNAQMMGPGRGRPTVGAEENGNAQ